MPVTTTPEPSATARRAALQTERDTLAAHLDSVRARRDALAPSHPEWRRLSAELRSVEAELGDYGAAIAALGDEVQAEMREAAHAHRVAQHAQAMQAAEQADALAAEMDRLLSSLCARVPHYIEWSGRCAAAGGVEPHPYRLGETVPTMDHIRDVILARLVAAGILDMEFMPAHIADAPAVFDDLRAARMTFPNQRQPQPMELAANASVLRDVHGAFKRSIAGAAPDRQRREQEHLAELSRQRAEREAADLTKPRVSLPPPLPYTRTVGAPVSAFSS